MHLRNRRGGDRGTEHRERFVERAAELRFDDTARVGFGEWRQPILQRLKTARDIGPENIGACSQKLAHLDRRRAELLKCLREAQARRELRVAALAGTTCVVTLMERTAGGLFWGRYDNVTPVRLGDSSMPAVNSARH